MPAGEELRGGGLGTPGKRPGKAGRMDCRDRGTIATVLEEEERIAEPVPGGGGICKKKHGRQRHCRRFFFSNASHLSFQPLDLDLTILIVVYIVCISTLISTKFNAVPIFFSTRGELITKGL